MYLLMSCGVCVATIYLFIVRVGHHSTSDDSSAYRSLEEINPWSEKTGVVGPIMRLRLYLEKQGWWNEVEENELRKEMRNEVLAALAEAEKKLKPDWREMFGDVYQKMPIHLK